MTKMDFSQESKKCIEILTETNEMIAAAASAKDDSLLLAAADIQEVLADCRLVAGKVRADVGNNGEIAALLDNYLGKISAFSLNIADSRAVLNDTVAIRDILQKITIILEGGRIENAADSLEERVAAENPYFKKFLEEIEKAKREMRQYHAAGDDEKSLLYVAYLALLYYAMNYKLCEDEIEEITARASKRLLGGTKIENSDHNTVFFYDGFGQSARGLGNIYVKTLLALGYHIVWALYDFAPDLEKIQQNFAPHKNVSFSVIPSQTLSAMMRHLREIVISSRAYHIIIYANPNDVAGIGTFSVFSGDICRYLINLTDHAYWLGKCAVDYVIDGRDYGYHLTVDHRGFRKEQVLMLPDCPGKRENYPFEGMPFDCEKYEFVFSGGSPYKIDGSDSYERLVRFLMDNYPQLRFVYAGDQPNKTLERLVKAYKKRFFFISERKDLEEILKRAKFFLNTYPLCGGLMVQYAAQNGCLPVSLRNAKMPIMDPASLLLQGERLGCIFEKPEDVCDYMKRLMEDGEFLEKERKKLEGQVTSPEEFRRQLGKILSLHTSDHMSVIKEDTVVPMEEFQAVYWRRMDEKMYDNIVVKRRKMLGI